MIIALALLMSEPVHVVIPPLPPKAEAAVHEYGTCLDLALAAWEVLPAGERSYEPQPVIDRCRDIRQQAIDKAGQYAAGAPGYTDPRRSAQLLRIRAGLMESRVRVTIVNTDPAVSKTEPQGNN